MSDDALKIRLPLYAVVDIVVGRVLRVSSRLARRTLRRRLLASQIATEVLALSLREFEARLRQQRGRLKSGPLVEELIRRCADETPRNKLEALRIIDVAEQVLKGLRPAAAAIGGERGWKDLQASLYAQRGNVLRVACRFEAGHQAFRTAYRSAALGSGDASLAARIYSLHAGLLTDSRHFGGALQALEWAERLFKELEDSRQLCRVYLRRASLLTQQGETSNAISVQIQAIELLEPGDDLPAEVAAWANLAEMYRRSGENSVAVQVLADSADLASELGADHTAFATWRWIRGRVNLALDKLNSAEEDLVWVQDFFQKASDPYNSGLAGLDLMKLYAFESRLDDLLWIAASTIDALEGEVFAPEVLEAVELLAQAVERRKVETKLIDRVADALSDQPARQSR